MSKIPEGATHVYKARHGQPDGYYKFADGRAYHFRPYSGGWLETGAESEYASCMHQLEPIVAGEAVMSTEQVLIEALEDLLEAEGALSIAVAERKARLAIAKAKGEGD